MGTFEKYTVTYLIFLGFIVIMVGLGAPGFIDTTEVDKPIPPQVTGNSLGDLMAQSMFAVSHISYLISIFAFVSSNFAWFGLLIMLPGLVLLIWALVKVIATIIG